MKKISVVIILLTIMAFSSQGQKVKWYSFEEAVELNKTERKKIFIDVYTNWCGWCKKMDQNTFTNSRIAKILNEHYYPVKLNAETTDTIYFDGHEFVNSNSGSRSPHQLAIALLQGKMSYPSIAYMDEQNRLLTAVPGYQTPETLVPILLFFAEDAYLEKKFNEFMKEFEARNQ